MKAHNLLATGTLLAACLLAPLAPMPSAHAQTLWQPRITVVWPHDGQGHPTSVAGSRAVNVRVQPANQVRCDENPMWRTDGSVRDFYLWVIRDDEPAERLDVRGAFVAGTMRGRCSPSVEYDNIPADLADHPDSLYRFVLGGYESIPSSNLWVHTARSHTSNPAPFTPDGYGQTLGSFDTRIQEVWGVDANGDRGPVGGATRVDIAFDILIHGTRQSAPLEFTPGQLDLVMFRGNEPPQTTWTMGTGQSGPVAEKTTYTVDGQTYPRWIIKDIAVDPNQPYSLGIVVFWGKVSATWITVWSYTPRTPEER